MIIVKMVFVVMDGSGHSLLGLLGEEGTKEELPPNSFLGWIYQQKKAIVPIVDIHGLEAEGQEGLPCEGARLIGSDISYPSTRDGTLDLFV